MRNRYRRLRHPALIALLIVFGSAIGALLTLLLDRFFNIGDEWSWATWVSLTVLGISVTAELVNNFLGIVQATRAPDHHKVIQEYLEHLIHNILDQDYLSERFLNGYYMSRRGDLYSGGANPERLRAVDIESELPGHAKIALLGAAGDGKSTTLAYVVRTLAYDALNNPDAKIPVLIRLDEFAGDDLRDFVARYVRRVVRIEEFATLFEMLARKGRLVLVLDGLNEMPGRNYHAIRILMTSGEYGFPSCRYILGCRERDYDFEKLDIPTLRLQPLPIQEIECYLSSFHARSAETYDSLVQRYQGVVGSIYGTRESQGAGSRFSSTNAFLLWCITQIGQQHVSTRCELFAAVCSSLLRTSASILPPEQKGEPIRVRKGLSDIGDAQVMAALPKLAFDLNSQRRVSCSINTASDVLENSGLGHDDAHKVLDVSINAGILVENHHGDVVRFRHETLQDYFTAHALNALYLSTGTLGTLAAEYGWDEAFQLLVELSENPDGILLDLLGDGTTPKRIMRAGVLIVQYPNSFSDNTIQQVTRSLGRRLRGLMDVEWPFPHILIVNLLLAINSASAIHWICQKLILTSVQFSYYEIGEGTAANTIFRDIVDRLSVYMSGGEIARRPYVIGAKYYHLGWSDRRFFYRFCQGMLANGATPEQTQQILFSLVLDIHNKRPLSTEVVHELQRTRPQYADPDDRFTGVITNFVIEVIRFRITRLEVWNRGWLGDLKNGLSATIDSVGKWLGNAVNLLFIVVIFSFAVLLGLNMVKTLLSGERRLVFVSIESSEMTRRVLEDFIRVGIETAPLGSPSVRKEWIARSPQFATYTYLIICGAFLLVFLEYIRQFLASSLSRIRRRLDGWGYAFRMRLPMSDGIYPAISLLIARANLILKRPPLRQTILGLVMHDLLSKTRIWSGTDELSKQDSHYLMRVNTVVPRLQNELRMTDPMIVLSGAEVLSRFGLEHANDTLVELSRRRDPFIRAGALILLARLNSPDIEKLANEALATDDYLVVQAYAARALGIIRTAGSAGLLYAKTYATISRSLAPLTTDGSEIMQRDRSSIFPSFRELSAIRVSCAAQDLDFARKTMDGPDHIFFVKAIYACDSLGLDATLSLHRLAQAKILEGIHALEALMSAGPWSIKGYSFPVSPLDVLLRNRYDVIPMSSISWYDSLTVLESLGQESTLRTLNTLLSQQESWDTDFSQKLIAAIERIEVRLAAPGGEK